MNEDLTDWRTPPLAKWLRHLKNLGWAIVVWLIVGHIIYWLDYIPDPPVHYAERPAISPARMQQLVGELGQERADHLVALWQEDSALFGNRALAAGYSQETINLFLRP